MLSKDHMIHDELTSLHVLNGKPRQAMKKIECLRKHLLLAMTAKGEEALLSPDARDVVLVLAYGSCRLKDDQVPRDSRLT